MNDIDLTVIVIDGDSTGKHYLQYLYDSGFRVNKIIVLKQKIPLRAVLSRIKRLQFTSPKRIERPLERMINDRFTSKIPNLISYKNYASSVSVLNVGPQIINDDSLYQYIRLDSASLYLFSGGGIVKERLLSIPNKKFLHIHPGIVPDIRGADCLFWSVLLRGRPGYSLFYISKDIDEGDVLYQEEFELPNNLYLSKQSYEIDVVPDSISLLRTLDLHYRSITLVNYLKKHFHEQTGIEAINSTPQKLSEGRLYFVMHPDIKKIAISRLLFYSDEINSPN